MWEAIHNDVAVETQVFPSGDAMELIVVPKSLAEDASDDSMAEKRKSHKFKQEKENEVGYYQ